MVEGRGGKRAAMRESGLDAQRDITERQREKGLGGERGVVSRVSNVAIASNRAAEGRPLVWLGSSSNATPPQQQQLCGVGCG